MTDLYDTQKKVCDTISYKWFCLETLHSIIYGRWNSLFSLSGGVEKKKQMVVLYATQSVCNLDFRPSVAMDQKCIFEFFFEFSRSACNQGESYC